MKVNDYVRAKDDLGIQLICKLNEIYENGLIDEYFVYTDKGYWDNKHIIKSSPNIIDLIEIGDYVNGLLVVEYDERNNAFICECEGMECGNGWIETNEDIKSIVTKEQFEAMQYKVGE